MILFHSVDCNDLSSNCLRRRLLEHFQNRRVIEIAGIELGELERQAHSANRGVEKPEGRFDSWFEVDVALAIARKGYHVIPQYEFAGKKIDLVVQYGAQQLAVECDGDFWHDADKYDADMDRQRMLERCGWEFFRIRGSEFHYSRDKVLERLWMALENRGVKPMPRNN